MPHAYSIHLFGKPFVSNEAGNPVPGLSVGKPLALLSYLVVQGKTPREELIGILWGDVPDGKARNAFRQALHRLRSALGEDAVPHDPDWVFVADELRNAADVSRFEELLEKGQPEKALDEYKGDFLSGVDFGERAFDQWRDGIRKRYKAKFRDALRTLIQIDTDSGAITRALRRTSVLLSSDPRDAEAAILHASTLLGAGRRTEAQQVLEEFEHLYRQDFDGPAPASVKEFLSRLRRSRGEYPENGTARQPPRFLGRENEISLLLGRLRALESGNGSVVIVGGEAGIGKTRLINEFFLRARDLGSPLLLRGREHSPDAAIAYASIAEALRGMLDAPGVAGTGQHLLAEAARLLPQLRDRFSLPASSEISDDAGRLRFYEGIAALMDAVAYEQPVCIALDDFHNSSAATYGLVEYLAERLSGAPILFLIAGRSTPLFAARRDSLLSSLTRSWAPRERTPAHLELSALERSHARELVHDLIGEIADELSLQDIADAGGGIPFRIIEACERIRSGDDGANTPMRIRDVLWGRLQRCTQAEQRLFVTVALFDRPVSIRLLAAASHLPEKSALDAALALEREGLVQQVPDGVCPAHDFSGEIALAGTGPAGRALLAGWAAEALASDGSGSAAELARLFALAGRRKEAFTYSRSAAFDAMTVGETQQAARHLETAAATAPTLKDREEVETIMRSLAAQGRLLQGEISPVHPDGATEAVQPADEGAESEGDREEPAAKTQPKLWNRRGIRPAVLTMAALAAVLFGGLRLVPRLSAARIPGTSIADSLIVARALNPRDTVIAFATGPLGSPLRTLDGATRHGLTRTWIDSLRLPWTNPLPSPDGRNVALERITKNGSELYVISMDRRDTIQLRSGEGDDFSSAWSPDSRWLLGTHGEMRSDGAYRAELFGYSIFRGGPRIAFDTLRSSSVVEAAWSPDGSHVAWTTRIGPEHQQEIFLSDADGQNVVDISNSAAEDYSIAWSPDGRTLAFTSERSGRAELYAEDISTGIMRRLTWEGAHADHAAFSPDGRWLAYESTQSGNPAVYVMPSGGGTGRSVTSASARVTLVGWRGHPVPYIDQVFLDAPPIVSPGDTGMVVVRTLDRQGNQLKVPGVRVTVLDPKLLRLLSDPQQTSDSSSILALARGLARVTATAGSWRADTAFIPIGLSALALIDDHFETGVDKNVWRLLGVPTPVFASHAGKAGSGAVVARSDREWQSGLLSRAVFPVRRGLSADVWVSAPFSATGAPKSLVFALVAADPAEVVDSEAPHFLRLATVSWLGEAGRMSYAVGREVYTESLKQLAPGDSHSIRISIGDDDTVLFYADGVMRWKSSLRVVTAGPNSRAQLWLGSQAGDNSIVFDDVLLSLRPTPAKPQQPSP